MNPVWGYSPGSTSPVRLRISSSVRTIDLRSIRLEHLTRTGDHPERRRRVHTTSISIRASVPSITTRFAPRLSLAEWVVATTR
ncbi:MAG: hypothetical protein EPN48_07550 [Microbacteriaceae bacterium]|nr:MAG: hypothetical protein EPN48_07550 [Microbacteriaceae bacterium]